MAKNTINKAQADELLDQIARDGATKNLSGLAKLSDATEAAGVDGGLGGSELAGILGKGAGGLAIAGDVTIFADGKSSNTTKAAAAANAAGTAATFAPAAAALGVDASIGWVPVAGQVVVLASGVYLAYEGIKPFHNFVNNTASDVAGWF